MKKIRPLIIVITALALIATIILLMIRCNPAISTGFNRSILSDNDTEVCCGIVISKKKNDLNKDVDMTFCYGYLKIENLTDFHLSIYVEDEEDGVIFIRDEDIINFYSEENQCERISFFRSDVKYQKYLDEAFNFKDLKSGKLIIKITCKDELKQEHTSISTLTYKVSYDKLIFE